MIKYKDLTGRRFGKWIVLKYSYTKIYPNGSQKKYWLCKCDCGQIKNVQQSNLLSGRSSNCGCTKFSKDFGKDFGKWNITHNKSGSRLYIVWSSMKTRCYNKKANNYKFYGERGIKICNEWKDNFETFFNWAINNNYNETAAYGECTLDRIDVNGNYEPDNCRWVNMKIQAINKRQLNAG